jgi:CheY-like chemotaxis protein
MEQPARSPPNPIVLLVDDELIVRKLAAAIFQGAGYRMFEACAGLSILEECDDIRTVLTAIEMSGEMRGLDPAPMARHRRADYVGLRKLPAGSKFLPKPDLPRSVIGKMAALMVSARPR